MTVVDTHRSGAARRRGRPVPYDFRRPMTLPREHVRRVEFAVETFTRQLATQLATRLRTNVQVSTEDIVQQTYDEYVSGMSSPQVVVTFDAEGLGGTGLIQLAPETALACIDRLLGGPGAANQPVRPLTEIEEILLTGVNERALAAMAYAFESIMPMQPRLTGLQYDPQFVQALGASEMVFVARMEMTIASVVRFATLMLPMDGLANRLSPAGQARTRTAEQKRAAAAAQASVTAAMDDVPVTVSASFEPLPLRPSELLELAVGDVLRLPHHQDRPLGLVSSGTTVANAVAARRGSRLACLVVDVEENDPR